MWVKPEDVNLSGTLVCQAEGPGNYWALNAYSNGRLNFTHVKQNITRINMSSPVNSLKCGKWHHVVMHRDVAEYSLYVDGVQVAYGTNGQVDNFQYDGVTLGARGTFGVWYKGYMDEVRIDTSNPFSLAPVVGLTDTYTVPTTPHIKTGSTKFLIDFRSHDESDIVHVPDFHGNAKTDTTEKVFGESSISFDGTNSYLSLPDHEAWNLYETITQDYTIDFRVKFTNVPITTQMLMEHREGTSIAWAIQYNTSTNTIRFIVLRTPTIYIDIDGGNIADTDWHHIALVKKGGSPNAEYAIYLDGVQVSYGITSTTDMFSGPLTIGRNSEGAGVQYFDGNIDEIRITCENSFYASPNPGLTDSISVPNKEYDRNALPARNQVIIIT